MKAIIGLITGFSILLTGGFFVYFILPLGLMGASSEKMMNLSFFVFIGWSLAASLIGAAGGLLIYCYLSEKTSLNNLISIPLTIVICLIAGFIFSIIGWILATIIGNQ